MPNDSFATIFHMAAAEGRSPSHGSGAALRELDADDEARYDDSMAAAQEGL